MIAMHATVPAPVRARYVRDGHWSESETLLTRFVGYAARFPDKAAVVDDAGRSFSYAELDDAASRLAASLAERGIEAGDVIGVQLPNRYEAVLLVCALEKLGAVINPLVPMYRDRELVYMANRCASKALVVPGVYRNHDHNAMARRVAERVPTLKTLITLDDAAPSGLVGLSELLRAGETLSAHASGHFNDVQADPDAVVAVLFTSGTEADPKGAIHSHNTMTFNHRAIGGLLGLGEDDNVFMPSPVGHGTGYGCGIRFALYLGSTVVLQDVWDPARAAQLISEHRCAYMHASTPFAHDLLGLPDLAEYDLRGHGLRYFVSGGVSIPSGFAKRLRDATGALLLRMYGQTEGFTTSINRPEDPFEILESRDGRPPDGVEVAIRDEDGNVLPPGTQGEATCRGPHRCLGFVAEPDRTAAAIDGAGWLRMGDLCVKDVQGYLTVVGRKKETISRGGYKYSPREIEDILHLHPAIARVAVVRMRDPRLGEKACAFVVTKGDESLTLEELTDFLRAEGVALFKLPERLEVVDELPMTASGKIQKYVLEQKLDDLQRDDELGVASATTRGN